MGRDAGFIAVDVGISAGAEHILVPEALKRLKSSAGIIVAEGEREGGAFGLAEKIRDAAGEVHGKVTATALRETWEKRKVIDRDLWRLAAILAT